LKLLFDENLSPKLVTALNDIFDNAKHVRDFGLSAKSDLAIWQLAKAANFIIVTKDDDFRHLSFLHGAPPKVVIVALGNVTTAQIERAIRSSFSKIRDFSADAESSVLALSD
jgi:predicted nuclease of predicted toxin-antitoxin system